MNHNNEMNESQEYNVNLKMQVTEKYSFNLHLHINHYIYKLLDSYKVQKHAKLNNFQKDNSWGEGD